MNCVTTSARDAFKAFLSTLFDLPEADWEQCASLLMTESYPPRREILRSGDVCDRVRFLVSGLARSYLPDATGRDFTWALHFATTGTDLKSRFLVDYASFTQAEPSRLCIEALSEVEVVSLKKSDVERLFAGSRVWANAGRLIAELAYHQTHHRVLSLLSQPAKARYEQLLRENPALIHAAPQHYVASYLGITPQSLSRLRRDLALPNVNDTDSDRE